MYYRENEFDCFKVNINGNEKILKLKYICSNLHVHHFLFSTYFKRSGININSINSEISVVERIFKKDNSYILNDILQNLPEELIIEIRSYCSSYFKMNLNFVSTFLQFDFTRNYIIVEINNKFQLCKNTDISYDRYEILPVIVEIKNLSAKQLLNKYFNLTLNMIFLTFIFHLIFYLLYTVKRFYLINGIFFNSIILYFIYDLLLNL